MLVSGCRGMGCRVRVRVKNQSLTEDRSTVDVLRSGGGSNEHLSQTDVQRLSERLTTSNTSTRTERDKMTRNYQQL